MSAHDRLLFTCLATALPFAVAATAQEPALFPASKHGGGYMFSYYLPPAPGATPWAPCWSPDGKWIAISMQGSIWKLDPETGGAEEIASDSGYASAPTWSPDGKWIAYTSEESGQRIQLRILNLAAGQSQALTDDDQIYLDPVFSPDGARLAYVSTQPNGYFNIYVRGIRDGQWDGPPVTVTRDNEYPRERLYFGKWDMHTQPAWTPDGKELVFVTNRDVSLGSGDLWRAPAKENGMREGRRIFREQTLYRTRPHVSPEGRRIVYASFAGGADQFNNLYVIPLAGGAPYKLTFGAFDHFHPRWSPDGRRIAFVSNEDGPPQLCVIETHGGGLHKIRITERRWKRPMGRLRIRVVEGTAGKRSPARIHGLAADGRFYAPASAYVRYGASGRPNFYTAGDDAFDVPPGKMTVEAVKGFEFQPASHEVESTAGRTVEVVLTLRRLANLGAKGWYGGSTHVHTNYGGNLHHTPDLLAI
jgi:dipeptidyl aminopeptidase/acylaminoacyl peptidase